MSVEIPLRRHNGTIRAVAIVDDEDAGQAEHRWSLHSEGYVVRMVDRDGRRIQVSLHREIMGCERGDGVEIDHENGDPLDNRRSNLRPATKALNQQNRHSSHSATGRRGVCLHKSSGLYMAYARLHGKQHIIGYRKDPDEAAALASAWRAEHMPFSSDAGRAA